MFWKVSEQKSDLIYWPQSLPTYILLTILRTLWRNNYHSNPAKKFHQHGSYFTTFGTTYQIWWRNENECSFCSGDFSSPRTSEGRRVWIFQLSSRSSLKFILTVSKFWLWVILFMVIFNEKLWLVKKMILLRKVIVWARSSFNWFFFWKWNNFKHF